MQKGIAQVYLLIVLLIIGAGGYLYFKSSNKPVIPQPTPFVTPTKAADETANWKTYSDSKKLYSFQYPASWEVLDEVPQNYKAMSFDPSISGWKLENWLNSKMFSDKCSGPILRNTKVNTTLVAFEIIAKNGDGAFCWSNGDFTNTYKRTINTLASPSEIDVIKWRLGDYVFPVTRDNSGQKYSPEWKGDLFQQILIPVQNSKDSAFMVLVYKNGTDETAEQVFDQILSTFKFTSVSSSTTPGPILNDCFRMCPSGKAVDCSAQCP